MNGKWPWSNVSDIIPRNKKLFIYCFINVFLVAAKYFGKSFNHFLYETGVPFIFA